MSISTHSVEQFEVAGSHFEIGFAIGKRFAKQIHWAFDTYEFFQQKLLPYHRSVDGRARYQKFLEIHQSYYPDYIAELEGLAQGAERPFEELFLVNFRGEYREYLHEHQIPGCSDCAIVTDKVALMGHNEDGAAEFKDNIYLVHVKPREKPAFTALSYPGFLCGNAFGFNSNGICFSIDNVRPIDTRLGVGRHFMARSLFEATSLADAIKRVTLPGRASGFNYMIGSLTERQVVGVEVSPTAQAVREVEDCYFHANHYQEIDQIAQIIGSSSQTRVETCAAILQNNPPVDAHGILTILGDQTNKDYPVYRAATPPDSLATFCTALFDLDRRYLRVYMAHPTQAPDEFVEFMMQ